MRNRRRDRARDEMPDVDGKVHRCAPRQYCGISRDAMLRFNLAIKILFFLPSGTCNRENSIPIATAAGAWTSVNTIPLQARRRGAFR